MPKFIVFDVSTFEKDAEIIFNEVKKQFGKNKVAIRSSSVREDNNFSNAGKFHSELNVKVEKKNIFLATKKVINSYDPRIRNKEKFIIQRMITDSKMTGVVFTRDQNNGSPFITINFSLGKKTDLITSGKQNGYIFRYLNTFEPKSNKYNFNKIHKFICKLKSTLKLNNLDIEFAISKSGKINLLQVRKLNCKRLLCETKVISSYKLLEKKLNKTLNDNSFLHGKFTIYSTMTDWNPAEIIGIKPNPLSYSLYSELITDYIWSKSRANFNYCDLGETPLMFNFLGTPYIDLRADFNSFVPNNLNESLKKKLVTHYLTEFKKKPGFYFDKVESELIISNLDFSIKKKIGKLKNFNKKEIYVLLEGLGKITNTSFEILYESILKYEKLDILLKRIKLSKSYSINKIYNYINICKNFGTLPFANIARCAFISMNFLNSMVEAKIISSLEKKIFLNSFQTITSEMLYQLEGHSKKGFLKKFGHLRPSTYDINSANYRDNYELYFGVKKISLIQKKSEIFKFSHKQEMLIEKRLKELNLSIGYEEFINFIKESIIHREKSKFYFTKAIELIFTEIKKIGKRFDISENDLCFIDIKLLKNFYNNLTLREVKKTLKENIRNNKNNYVFNKHLSLPNNLIKESDIYSIFETDQKPTFVTNQKVSAEIFILSNININKKLDGKIICMEKADPGFDFIFTKKIKGLITEYGGPNSHMCIRCSELDIPAAVGVGKGLFEKIKQSKNVFLDCSNQNITIQ